MASIAHDETPVQHRGGPPLYGRMMKAIQSGHTFGNRIRMLKLPLIFLEESLYAGAIAQFYWLTATLEAEMDKQKHEPMVAAVITGLDLGRVTSGYESDLQQLYGIGWRDRVDKVRTAATTAYMHELSQANPASLAAAAFILYGALVVGGGKMTQAKVRKVIPRCQHMLFDVADDMRSARQKFKNTFTAIGKDFPEDFATLEQEAARFMSLNNSVIISIRCWGIRATAIGAVSFAVIGGLTACSYAALSRRLLRS